MQENVNDNSFFWSCYIYYLECNTVNKEQQIVQPCFLLNSLGQNHYIPRTWSVDVDCPRVFHTTSSTADILYFLSVTLPHPLISRVVTSTLPWRNLHQSCSLWQRKEDNTAGRVWGKCIIPHSPPTIRSPASVPIDPTQPEAREQGSPVSTMYTHTMTFIYFRAQSRRRKWKSVSERSNRGCSAQTPLPIKGIICYCGQIYMHLLIQTVN